MNCGNIIHSIPTAVKEGFFSVFYASQTEIYLFYKFKQERKKSQIFIVSWPLCDRQLADYLMLQQKDSAQQSKDIIMNNRSFTSAKIKVDAGRVMKSVAFQCCDQGA